MQHVRHFFKCIHKLSLTGSSLQCYQCRYHEINGKPDDKAGDKESCYSGVGLELSPCTVTHGPLVPGLEFRCYTSPYEKTTSKGDTGKALRWYNGVNRKSGIFLIAKYKYGLICDDKFKI